ncbi:hypothetical protein SAMN04515647_3781 [Cohaesibacter sp. ES.047]|uniref:DUF6414 family protein n=1 Tax=Cohaesibacter sp. ES.047 TaxID=1798205 RepID=UPI000BB8EA46|nr:hypothetical protein [Cohaesibacter sp. ES.047]SNY93485.1 hypothetical protein SAMN04515647_3781 [Cohaesibacter sp. ES.047]
MTDYSNQLIDFMYVDRPKVSSFLAQFMAEGLVVEHNISQETEANRKLGLSTSARIASFLGMSVDASGEYERGSADKSSETIKKNPEWAQAKALIQYVADAQVQEPDDLKVGTLRILIGKLQIYDLTPFRQIADNSRLLDAITKAIMLRPETLVPDLSRIDDEIASLDTGNLGRNCLKSAPQKRKELKQQRETIIGNFNIYLDAIVEGISHVVRYSPFSVVAVLETSDDCYWFSLKQESLLHDQGDTLLKYGYAIDGDWSVACILDGDSKDFESREEDEPADEAIIWATLARPIAIAGRKVVGRPDHFRSLMPLVVFRSLGQILR